MADPVTEKIRATMTNPSNARPAPNLQVVDAEQQPTAIEDLQAQIETLSSALKKVEDVMQTREETRVEYEETLAAMEQEGEARLAEIIDLRERLKQVEKTCKKEAAKVRELDDRMTSAERMAEGIKQIEAGLDDVRTSFEEFQREVAESLGSEGGRRLRGGHIAEGAMAVIVMGAAAAAVNAATGKETIRFNPENAFLAFLAGSVSFEARNLS